MKLADLINKAMVTLAEISRGAKVSRPTLYKILKGERVSKLSVKKVCAYFGVKDEDYLK